MGELGDLVVGDLAESRCLRDEVGVGGLDAVYVGENLYRVGLERGCDGGRGGV